MNIKNVYRVLKSIIYHVANIEEFIIKVNFIVLIMILENLRLKKIFHYKILICNNK
jgi:hypothetical protein